MSWSQELIEKLLYKEFILEEEVSLPLPPDIEIKCVNDGWSSKALSDIHPSLKFLLEYTNISEDSTNDIVLDSTERSNKQSEFKSKMVANTKKYVPTPSVSTITSCRTSPKYINKNSYSQQYKNIQSRVYSHLDTPIKFNKSISPAPNRYMQQSYNTKLNSRTESPSIYLKSKCNLTGNNSISRRNSKSLPRIKSKKSISPAGSTHGININSSLSNKSTPNSVPFTYKRNRSANSSSNMSCSHLEKKTTKNPLHETLKKIPNKESNKEPNNKEPNNKEPFNKGPNKEPLNTEPFNKGPNKGPNKEPLNTEPFNKGPNKEPLNTEPFNKGPNTEPLNTEPFNKGPNKEPLNTEPFNKGPNKEPLNTEPFNKGPNKEPLNTEPFSEFNALRGVPTNRELRGPSRSALAPLTTLRVAHQARVDPDKIFSQPGGASPLRQMFGAHLRGERQAARGLPPAPQDQALRLLDRIESKITALCAERGDSGNWNNDTFSLEEEVKYKKDMGYL